MVSKNQEFDQFNDRTGRPLVSGRLLNRPLALTELLIGNQGKRGIRAQLCSGGKLPKTRAGYLLNASMLSEPEALRSKDANCLLDRR